MTSLVIRSTVPWLAALLCALGIAACGAPGPKTETGSGTASTCTAEYAAPTGERWSAMCDDGAGLCDCFYNGTNTGTCEQADGGCYPDGKLAGATCCPGIPPAPR
jgi:hypothetical protein